jgi:choline-sulfatase
MPMAETERPNIFLIMSDQHSKHVLGAYGNEIVRTPNLDRLAAEGMLFTDAYCPSPLCVPSRMSFMTSRTPNRNRAWNNRHVLDSGIPTWAHLLGAAGYETTLIGRGQTHYQWFDEVRTEASCEYLRERAADKGGRPFAAVLGYVLPHCPFVAPTELFDYYYDRVDIPPLEDDQPASVTRFRRIRGILDPPMPAERIRVARAAYFGLCEHVDRLVGQVLDCLEATGLAKNTLVIYCTDHGDMAGEHGCWWKSNYYEGSVGVPMMARLPGIVPAGSVSRAVCNLMDLGATFADIAGTEFHPPVDGRSLWPTLQGRHPADWKDETFSELIDFRGGFLPSRMIRSGPWKLWVYADDENLPPVLFNLAEDGDELHDLAADDRFADIRDELLRKVHDGWDVEAALAQARDKWDSYATLAKWGKAVQPTHPDEVVMPPAEYEANVELL